MTKVMRNCIVVRMNEGFATTYLRIDEEGTHWYETLIKNATMMTNKKAVAMAIKLNKEAREHGTFTQYRVDMVGA